MIRHFYRLIQILSLDVVAGSLATGAMLVCLLELNMPGLWWLALGLSVWVIYTADHLLDAWRLKDQAHTSRHLFHYRYFKIILAIWLMGLISCVSWIPCFLPRSFLYFGLVMGVLVLIHLGLIQLIGDRAAWFLHKELGVGLIYSLGVWGGPLLLYSYPIPTGLWLAFLQFLILALMNLLIFSLYERDTDEQDGHTSFVRAIGLKNARLLVVILGTFMLIIMVWQCMHAAFWSIQWIYLLMLGLLSWINLDERRFRPRERYRIWGDAVFIFPLLYCLPLF